MDDFEQALKQEEYNYHFERGGVVEGTVIEHTTDGAYVEIGGKSPGFIPRDEVSLNRVADIATVLPKGEKMEFVVVREQDAEGQVVLSRRQLAIKQAWQELEEIQEKGEVIEMRVTGSNRGGLMGQVYGLRAFIPRSHLLESEKQLLENDQVDSLVGQRLNVTCLEVSQERRKLVLSQREAARSAAIQHVVIGELVSGTVVNLQPYGAFVDIGGLTGLLHVKQISAKTLQTPHELLSVGQPIKVVILDVDEMKNRLSFATKMLESYAGEILEKFDAVMANAEERFAASKTAAVQASAAESGQSSEPTPAPAVTEAVEVSEPEASADEPDETDAADATEPVASEAVAAEEE
ncbi:MAG: 30S ribosomal protein S1 [Spirulina sp. SIO3F2]|nr:30S ribosomal protein S1 [Spirulina sp. SIO3F2]